MDKGTLGLAVCYILFGICIWAKRWRDGTEGGRLFVYFCGVRCFSILGKDKDSLVAALYVFLPLTSNSFH